MDINTILQPNIQEFIVEKTGSDISKLALLKNPFPEVDYKILLNQVEARTKSKDKLPTWFGEKDIIFPSKISIEQTSSEAAALYKSGLLSGDSLIDLTGGYGVDDYYFSKKINRVIHCEINEELSEIVKHNFQKLNCKNIDCYQGDSSSILHELNQYFDWIYIDPSRRNDTKGKVFMLKDCFPNVPELLDEYFQFTTNILIKTAPILDISAGLSELKNVKEIHIVAIDNEVKELLWLLEKSYANSIKVKAVNIQKTKTDNSLFTLNSESEAIYSIPQKYIYEPNSAILKSGEFDVICDLYNVSKLHKHSHLYTSNNLVEFPGRIFEMNKVIDYSKSSMKEFLENNKANITTRNFPETVENLRKKWKIKDGGNLYCFFTTNLNNDKIVLLCTKINE